MTTPSYTPEDVQRLVEAGELLLLQRDGWNDPRTKLYANCRPGPIVWSGFGDLKHALEPFQPDPDAEVIEAMVAAYLSHIESVIGPLSKDTVDVGDPHRHMAMRAALTAYRAHQEGGTR